MCCLCVSLVSCYSGTTAAGISQIVTAGQEVYSSHESSAGEAAASEDEELCCDEGQDSSYHYHQQ